MSNSNYQILQKSSPNFWKGRNGQKAIAICDHIMQGTMEGSDSEFKNGQVSAHFGVAKDGRIWQWVAVTDAAWANGPINRPDTSIPWIVDAQKNKVNPNNLTISIEHEGKTGELFSDAQYQATLWLHQKLIKENNITLDGQHIIGHFQLDSVNRPFCPGKGFPKEQLMMDLQKAVQYDPSGGFSVGEGAVKILTQNGLTARTNENYYHDEAGQKVSLVYTNNDKLRVLTTFSPATGLWDTQLVQNVG